MRKTLILAVCILSAFALARAEEPPLVTSAGMQEPEHLDTLVRVQGTSSQGLTPLVDFEWWSSPR